MKILRTRTPKPLHYVVNPKSVTIVPTSDELYTADFAMEAVAEVYGEKIPVSFDKDAIEIIVELWSKKPEPEVESDTLTQQIHDIIVG